MPVDRRSLLKSGGAAVAAGAVTTIVAGRADPAAASSPPGSAATAGAASRSSLRGFAAPDVAARPWFRYWVPGATVSADDVRDDIRAMAAGGFGGAEITYLSQYGVTATAEDDFGSQPWIDILTAALDELRRHGMHASMLIGPAWPAAVPTIVPDDAASSKELQAAHVVVDGGETYDGDVPTPSADLPDGATEQMLVAVQAFRCSADTVPDSGTIPLAVDGYVDLTDTASSGSLSWTAPEDGQWLVIAFWLQPTGQSLDSGLAYVVDHYSAAGADAVTDFWDDTLLTTKIRSVLRSVSTSIFEDSIELSSGTHWTPAMLEEFRRRRGYDLTPYLPAVIAGVASGFGQTAVAPYSISSPAQERVLQDYHQTLSDLYLDHHTWRIQNWAHSRGLSYKAQAYGGQLDTGLAMATIDNPEGESLDDGQHSEKWRVITGGAHLGGKNIVSAEADATLNRSYSMTWSGDMLPMSNGNFAAGVNRDIIHGFPTSTGPQAEWPGNDGFAGITTGDNWGPRMPTWTHITDVSGYLARCQYVGQAGVPRIDVAVYRPGLDIGYGSESSGIGMWTDTALAAAGYSYDYQSSGSLRLEDAAVRHGVLAPSGPGYRALVLFDQDTLELDIATRILRYAEAGLPIVIVGDLPTATPGYADAATADRRLAAVVARLARHRRVHRVAGQADVPAALRAAGVRPDFEPSTGNADLAAVHRVSGPIDYYLVTNLGTAATRAEVSLAGSGTPYLLGAFDGTASAVPVFRTEKGRVILTVSLAGSEARIIALGPAGRLGSVPRASATSSEVDLTYAGRDLLARATAAGRYRVVLSGGRRTTVEVGSVPAAQRLDAWTLRVQQWLPGDSPTDTDTSTTTTATLSELAPWSSLEGLADASGIGTYTTTFDRPTGASGAILDLGSVVDTVRVRLNGVRLPAVNILDTRIDLGPYLRAGKNTLQVEVASTLCNAVRVARGGQWADFARQDYGLLGPVTLTPYVDVPVR
ncbi:MAG: glycosyl hydrolase [Nocardioides sp.]|uniref:glycosyl hydrolase n=1 Tax=Nocardioides sp. TaxID=35761 RepID=UPI0039E6B5CF